MSLKNTPLLTSHSIKGGFFSVKNPKYVKELKITQSCKSSLSPNQTRQIKTCKLLRVVKIFFLEDTRKQPLYTLLCKLHQKILFGFNTNSGKFYEIIRYPRLYNLKVNSIRSWKLFFSKRLVYFLKIHIDPLGAQLSEKNIRWIMYYLHHSTKVFDHIKEVELAGNIVNKPTEKLIDHLMQTIYRICSSIHFEIKVWDNDDDNLYWLDIPIIRKTAASVYFVNRCDHANTLLKPIKHFPSYIGLQKLEFWIKLFPANDFSSLEQLHDCKLLKELRVRFEFELDLLLVSQKFLKYIKFPTSLTYLNLYISGLRLYWIGDTPKGGEIETDSYVAPFLAQIENLSNLRTFHFTLYEFRIEFSSLVFSIIHRFKALKELFLVMVLQEFNFKKAEKFPILDFGFLCKKLSKIFAQLSLLSIEFPCIFLEDFDSSIESLTNLKTLSLGYRIIAKDKSIPKLNLVLSKLDSDKIRELYFGDCNTQDDEEFKIRFDAFARLSLLENLTMAITIKSINDELFNHFCICISKLTKLRRLSCRFERAVIQTEEWTTKLKAVLAGMSSINAAFISTKDAKIEFEH